MSLRRQFLPGFTRVRTATMNWCIRPEWHERLLGEGSPDWFALAEEQRAHCIKRGEGRIIWRIDLNQETPVFLKAFETASTVPSLLRNFLFGSPPWREETALSRAEGRNIPSPR